jgi:hypothetical protein
MSLLRRCVLTLSFFLLAVPMLWAQSAKTSIIIERQLVRFITSGEAVEWRLVVANQQGEIIYDSGPVYGNALEWPLKNQQGEAIESGLYTYTLTSKGATEETARTQRGHLMLARPSESERVWITNDQSASIGADNSARKLAVISGETTVGGAELPGIVPRREVSEERAQSPQRTSAEANAEKTTAPTATNGTANRVAKFAADGTSLIDSAITEVGGNVGIGTTNPQSTLDYRSGLAPFFTRDIGTTNFGTPQSALQLGVTNLGSRNINVGPSFLFFGDNSAGTKSFLGRVSGVWENPTAGAEAGAILFQVRAGSGDTGASTERMRIRANGNVGIGTTNPGTKLEVVSTNSTAVWGTSTSLNSNGVVGVADNGTSAFGVKGSSTAGYGVVGVSTSGYGVRGVSSTGFAGSFEGKIAVSSSTQSGGDNTASFEALGIGLNRSHIHFGTTGDWFIRSAAAAGKVVLQDTGGNVGIGTASPFHRLSIIGGPTWTSNGWTGALALSNASAIGWHANAAGQRFGIGQTNGGLFFFRTASDPGTTGSPANYDLGITDNGHLTQARDKGGLVKAMVYIGSDATILRCYNGITGSSSGNCGFSVGRGFSAGNYVVDFGFQINDRFYSISLNSGCCNVPVAVSFEPGNTSSRLEIYVYETDDRNSYVLTNRSFMIIVY